MLEKSTGALSGFQLCITIQPTFDKLGITTAHFFSRNRRYPPIHSKEFDNYFKREMQIACSISKFAAVY